MEPVAIYLHRVEDCEGLGLSLIMRWVSLWPRSACQDKISVTISPMYTMMLPQSPRPLVLTLTVMVPIDGSGAGYTVASRVRMIPFVDTCPECIQIGHRDDDPASRQGLSKGGRRGSSGLACHAYVPREDRHTAE